jgi:hypothetical protein
MAPINLDINAVGIREVFAGMRFPAPRWRVIAQASHWGAGCECTEELTALPARVFHSLRDLTQAIEELRRSRTTATFRSRRVLRRPVLDLPDRRSA